MSWLDAVAYCNARSLLEHRQPAYVVSGASVTWNPLSNGYRLPTEAEWEHAARGGGAGPWAGSPDVARVAWYQANAGGSTHPVATLLANPLGLFDTSGNVGEWVWDRYGAYPTSPTLDPAGPDAGETRVIRGGSFSDAERAVRSAYRKAAAPESRSPAVGFRVALTGG